MKQIFTRVRRTMYLQSTYTSHIVTYSRKLETLNERGHDTCCSEQVCPPQICSTTLRILQGHAGFFEQYCDEKLINYIDRRFY